MEQSSVESYKKTLIKNDYLISLEYFAPSSDAPAITPLCPKTIAYIGFVKVLLVIPSEAPVFLKKTCFNFGFHF